VDSDSIKKRKQEIIERYGSWTAHNIHLGGGVYTIDNRLVGDEVKLRRILQIVCDVARAPLHEIRVLDLACLEGLYAVELARHGAEVAAIEVREANIEKARFARDILTLDRLQLYHDDIRNLSKEKYGYFDVVLCLGILYHLDVPDLFLFLEKMSEVCKRFAVIDTHISVTESEFYLYKGRKYWGRSYEEHSPDSSLKERSKSLWSSIDNVKSFWPTRSSLYNLLTHAGFTSVFECHTPPEIGKPLDRLTLLAIKGARQTLFSSQLINEVPQEDVPEKGNHGTADQDDAKS